MKKYIKPEITLVQLEAQQMIAESIGINSTAVDASAAEGRGDSDWDED